jgi:NAD(P)-dependent dehydrogenase (short-subunit alcohol dehydrogenase family)
MSSPLPHPVVVTGASTGIGRATVAALAAAGVRVFPTVRREADAQSLRSQMGDAVTPLLLDITDSDSVAAFGEQVVAAGPLSGLVNNAGIAVPAPAEYLPIEAFRRQLEVNLIGQLAVTQAVMPALRAGGGRIVTVGSIGGRLAGPLLGAYAASKFGLLGLTDSLRAELAPSGLRVILIEPGAVATPIWLRGRTTGDEIRAGLPAEANRRYAAVSQKLAADAERSTRHGAPPEAVADVIVRALTVKNPRHRYLVGRDAYALSMIARLPHRVRYRLVATR